MVASYRVVATLLTTLVCLGSYEQHYTQLLKSYINVVTRTCLGFYWYIRTLPWALHSLGHCTPLGVMCIYQSNPSLPCYNIFMYSLFWCVYTLVITWLVEKTEILRLTYALNPLRVHLNQKLIVSLVTLHCC